LFVESVRSRAFKHFDAGLRPSQLPDLGVPRETLYRYFQAWKKLHQDESWIRKTIPMTRRKVEHRKVWGGQGFLTRKRAFLRCSPPFSFDLSYLPPSIG